MEKFAFYGCASAAGQQEVWKGVLLIKNYQFGNSHKYEYKPLL
jgi:hypothetical protein